MRGGYGKWEIFDACLSFVSTGVCGSERRHTWKRMDPYRDRQKDGRFRCLMCNPVFTVSQLERCVSVIVSE